MTIEEKLQNFYDISMDTAREQSGREVADYQAALDKIYEEHCETARRQNDLQLKTEAEEIRKNNNMEISREQIQLKRRYSRREEELTRKLFDEVAEKLAAYKETPDYTEWMKAQVRRAVEFAGTAPVRIYVDPTDEEKIPALLEAAQADNLEILPSKESFGGGTRAVIRSRNVLIDHSFARRTAEVRESFQLREEI
ncbi:MAG: ATPase [Lachnospiraceae bacterium]|nr:ATPase [Lachnospiraceae bacterium]